MKLRCEMEVEVPDEVGEKMLAEQREAEEKNRKVGFRQAVFLEAWTYHVDASLHWTLNDETPAQGEGFNR